MDISLLFHTFQALIIAPFQYIDMLWICIPLLAIAALMAFCILQKEKKKSADYIAGINIFILVFSGSNLVATLASATSAPSFILKIALASGIILVGFYLGYMVFWHKHKIYSSILYADAIAYLAVVSVYGGMRIDFYFIAGSALLLGFPWLALRIKSFIKNQAHFQ